MKCWHNQTHMISINILMIRIKRNPTEGLKLLLSDQEKTVKIDTIIAGCMQRTNFNQRLWLYCSNYPMTIKKPNWVRIKQIYEIEYTTSYICINLNYYPLFRVRSWNIGMRCMSLYSYIGTRLQYRKGFFYVAINHCNCAMPYPLYRRDYGHHNKSRQITAHVLKQIYTTLWNHGCK